MLRWRTRKTYRHPKAGRRGAQSATRGEKKPAVCVGLVCTSAGSRGVRYLRDSRNIRYPCLPPPSPRARKKASRKHSRFRDANQNIFKKKAASYSPALHCSTIGAGGLNFSVRNGKRWDTAAITTWNVSFHYTPLSGILRQERVRVTYWTRQTERAQRSPNRLKLWSAAESAPALSGRAGLRKRKSSGH